MTNKTQRESASRDLEMLTDAELCKILRISPVTLRKHLREGPSRRRYASTGDIRLCRKVLIGGKRRWPRVAVERFLSNSQ
jgi:predicted site-specific integrase-resolvase